MKEYDIIVPLYYNDGTPIELPKFQDLAKQLLEHFDGVTFFPQPNEGWRKKDNEYFQDRIVLFRVVSDNARKAKPFLTKLKKKINEQFRQEETLILQRDVDVV